MSTNKPTPKHRLAPGVSEHIDRMVEEFRSGLVHFFRFHGMENIDAVCALLEEHGVALIQERIIDELKAGGIAQAVSKAKGGADANLKRAITFSLTRGDRLRRVGALIGLAEWSDEKFES